MRNFDGIVAESRQAAEVDQTSIEQFGVPSVALMETAGSKTADEVAARTSPGDLIGILCGKGNNGGDALAAARQLHASERRIAIFMVLGDKGLSEDAATNYSILQAIEAETGENFFCNSVEELAGYGPALWVDGIFGTGLNSEVREPVRSVLSEVNNHAAPVLALDIPSGLDGTSGQVLGEAIQAEITVMYGMAKLGAYLNTGPACCGNRKVVPLGFTGPAKKHLKRYILTPDVAIPVPAESYQHKYEAGIVYIAAGSEGMTGAVVTAAKAAWSAGAGGVVVLCPQGLINTFEYLLPEAVKIPVGNKEDKWFTTDHLKPVLDSIQTRHPHVLLGGPGAGAREQTTAFYKELLGSYEGKLIYDADALRSVEQIPEDRPGKQQLLLTPHRGEFSRIAGDKPGDDFELLQMAEELAGAHSCAIVVKGEPSVVTNGNETWITAYSTRAFNRFGFGDLLAGFIAARFLHRGREEACIAAMLEGYRRLKDVSTGNAGYIPKPLDLIR